VTQLEKIGMALAETNLDGWLFYDFRMSDPIAYRVLRVDQNAIATRRWFCFVRSDGSVDALVSAVEPHRLDALAPGQKIVYRSGAEMHAGLATILAGSRRIAMNYSPDCAIPYVSRVDAGIIDLVRATGVEIVSSADLIQRFEAALTPVQIESHRRAARHLRAIVDETFAEIARAIAARERPTEDSIQSFIMSRFAQRGLVTHDPPIVAVNAHSADPHYAPASGASDEIKRGDFVLIDLWAREPESDRVYADFTWVGFVGDEIPDEHARIFAIVADARDAAVRLIQKRVASGRPITGREADRAAREVIERAGFGANFVHRTGHSIGREVHGAGANLDSLETDDYRRLIENTCFSVEPGIYLDGRFGVRSETDVVIENGRATVSEAPAQTAIVPIIARFGS